ncbi:uncharacterized protein DS421_13g422500 [Arachis hypogaea]|nr:uncharacterized protein DS421_13g422500 [Arachis hypogaea]
MPGKPIDSLCARLSSRYDEDRVDQRKWLLVFTYNFCYVREDKIGSQPSAVLYHRYLFGQS